MRTRRWLPGTMCLLLATAGCGRGGAPISGDGGSVSGDGGSVSRDGGPSCALLDVTFPDLRLQAVTAMPGGGYAALALDRTDAGGDDFLRVLRLDEDGNTQWSYEIGYAPANASDLMAFTDGSVVIAAGADCNCPSGNQNVQVVKLDSSGQLLWKKTFGTMAPDDYQTVWAVPDGGAVVAWSGEDNVYDPNQKMNVLLTTVHIVRLSASGTQLWDKPYRPTSGFTDPLPGVGDVVELSDHTLAITGAWGSSGRAGFLANYDLNGDELSSATFGQKNINTLVPEATGAAFVGYQDSADAGGGGVWLGKLDSGLAVASDATLDLGTGDSGSDLHVLPDGDYVFGGPDLYDPTKIAIVRSSPDGQVRWRRSTFYPDPSKGRYPSAITSSAGGGVAIVGDAQNIGGWFTRLDANGHTVCAP